MSCCLRLDTHELICVVSSAHNNKTTISAIYAITQENLRLPPLIHHKKKVLFSQKTINKI